MQALLKFLSGKKTYIVAILSVISGVASWASNKESFSTAVTNVPGLLIFLGGVSAAVRAAVAKVEAALSLK